MKLPCTQIAAATALLVLGAHKACAFQRTAIGPTINTATCSSSNAYLKNRQSSPDRLSKTVVFSSLNSKSQEPEVDADALSKYALSGLIQMGCFFVLLNAFDLGVDTLNLDVPFWANGLFFYGCSIGSRVFNPLRNDRPDTADVDGGELVSPSWTPPGVLFPIMWLLIIGPIRAYSSAMIVDSAGEYANIATLSFLLHLSVGDIWNTINNVEKRVGAAASGVAFVVLSAANAAYQYYQVNPGAGELLGLTLLWLVTAGALVNSIWRLNPNSVTGENDPLVPVKGDVTTEFAWFGSNAE